MKNNEFYIGWMDKAPQSLSRHVKKVIVALIVVVPMIAIVVSASQKKFSTGNFEFGKLTQIKGIYFKNPVPNLKVFTGKDVFGNSSFITIPLIGYGKFGADGSLNDIQKARNIDLNQREVTLKGTLLYNDGKLLMQIDENDSFLVNTGNTAGPSLLPVAKNLGDQVIKGEIVDPKCFFGVMKPGQGKPHKDCAIRCILGGIPPVLKSTDASGRDNYYLVVSESGGRMNEVVKDFVAQPVTVNARVVKYDDWIVLYVKNDGIAAYSYIQDHFGDKLASCDPSCTK